MTKHFGVKTSSVKQAKVMNRIEFLELLPEGGMGLELGVAAGDYSRAICDRSQLTHIYGIDRYTDHHDDAEMTSMLEMLEDQIDIGRYTFLKGSFDNYLENFTDETFSFIYIDGYAHTGQEDGKTLDDWFCKLKPGGIFAGHDYHENWVKTVNVVDAFVAKHNLELNIIDGLVNDGDFPSWYVVKAE